MLALLGRIVWVLVAFALAASLATIVLFTVGGLWVGEEYAAEMTSEYGDPDLAIAGRLIGALLFAGAVAPAMTALPGIVAVVVGEALRIRTWVYYVLAGGGAVAVIPWLAGAPGSLEAPAADYVTIFASAGFAAGFLYWLLAGRNA